MKKKDKVEIETGSAHFHTIGSVEFWLSPTNRLFLVRGSRVVFTHLRGSQAVQFDDSTFEPGKKVVEKVREILRKQQEIRMGWLDPEDEETAYQFN